MNCEVEILRALATGNPGYKGARSWGVGPVQPASQRIHGAGQVAGLTTASIVR